MQSSRLSTSIFVTAQSPTGSSGTARASLIDGSPCSSRHTERHADGHESALGVLDGVDDLGCLGRLNQLRRWASMETMSYVLPGDVDQRPGLFSAFRPARMRRSTTAGSFLNR